MRSLMHHRHAGLAIAGEGALDRRRPRRCGSNDAWALVRARRHRHRSEDLAMRDDHAISGASCAREIRGSRTIRLQTGTASRCASSLTGDGRGAAARRAIGVTTPTIECSPHDR
jgi:hypothetical protein